MNKISIYISLTALLLSVFSFFYFSSKSELVYVDINQLLEGYNRTALVKKELDEKSNALKANTDSLMSDWQNELRTYEKERSLMTEKELALKQELLKNKQQQINNYQQTVQQQMQQENQKSTQTVINDINDFVKKYGASHNYRIIFGATGGGNVMYAKESSDLTDEILEALNREYEGR